MVCAYIHTGNLGFNLEIHTKQFIPVDQEKKYNRSLLMIVNPKKVETTIYAGVVVKSCDDSAIEVGSLIYYYKKDLLAMNFEHNGYKFIHIKHDKAKLDIVTLKYGNIIECSRMLIVLSEVIEVDIDFARRQLGLANKVNVELYDTFTDIYNFIVSTYPSNNNFIFNNIRLIYMLGKLKKKGWYEKYDVDEASYIQAYKEWKNIQDPAKSIESFNLRLIQLQISPITFSKYLSAIGGILKGFNKKTQTL